MLDRQKHKHKKRKKKNNSRLWLGRGLMLFIPSSFALCAYLNLYQIDLLWSWETVSGHVLSYIFGFFYFMALSSYFMAALGHPGPVAREWSSWDGNLDTRPEIPLHAKLNQTWLEQIWHVITKPQKRMKSKNQKQMAVTKGIRTITAAEGKRLGLYLDATSATAEDVKRHTEAGKPLIFIAKTGDTTIFDKAGLKFDQQKCGKCGKDNKCEEEEVPREKEEEPIEKVVLDPQQQFKEIKGMMKTFGADFSTIQWSSPEQRKIMTKHLKTQEKKAKTVSGPEIEEVEGDSNVIIDLEALENEKDTDMEEIESESSEAEGLDENDPRMLEIRDPFKCKFCERCNLYKPPRAHHCSTCNTCVSRLDHHCVFLHNCVGIDNYKYFFQFLFWTACCTSLYILMTFYFWFQAGIKGNVMFLIQLVFIPLAVGFLNMVVKLGKHHSKFLFSNRTQFEDMFEAELHKAKYQLGTVHANVMSIFGTHPLGWIFPIPTGLQSVQTKSSDPLVAKWLNAVIETGPQGILNDLFPVSHDH